MEHSCTGGARTGRFPGRSRPPRDMVKPLVPPRLYAIADGDALGPDRLPQAVETMATVGVEWIQIRAKQATDRILFELVESCLTRLDGRGASLWINDRPDVAALLPVAGVHLGQDDMPPAAAREVVGSGCWIGRSTHDLEQAEAAATDREVDVVAIGPIFETDGKDRPDPVVGLEMLRRIRARVAKLPAIKPLVAIGGIDAENLESVLAAGADTVAVIGAVCRGHVARNCQRLLGAAKEAR